jgi:hypothetical protein
MLDLGLVDRLRGSCCQAERANPLYRAYRAQPPRGPIEEADFEPVTAEPTLASAIQIGNPGLACPRRSARSSRCDGVVEQASEDELADAVGARRPHRPVQLPAHRGRARVPREAPSRAGHRQPTTRSS